jgi:hypothetical protein
VKINALIQKGFFDAKLMCKTRRTRPQTQPFAYTEQMKNRPPMPSRDLGGRLTLDNTEDDTPIKKMFVLNDGLLLITEKCTYGVQEADQIDPDRTNPALPPRFQQKLFDYGTNSESYAGRCYRRK